MDRAILSCHWPLDRSKLLSLLDAQGLFRYIYRQGMLLEVVGYLKENTSTDRLDDRQFTEGF